MSEPQAPTPDEEQLHEDPPAQPVADPESPEHAPEDPEADEPGPSDDDATGADTADDEDEDAQPDEPAPAPPAPPATESQLEAVTNALAKEARRYGNAVARIFGDDWLGCMPCPLCATDFPGVLTPAPRSDDVIAAVRPIIGLPDLSNYRQDAHARACDQCDGKGMTLTGSTVPKYATIQCSACKGRGFRSSAPEHEVPAYVNGGVVEAPATHVEPEAPPAMPPAAVEALEQMLAAARGAGVGG